MAADSTLALSLVEEFVSGLQDSKAKDAAKGKRLLSRFAGDIYGAFFIRVTPERL